MPPKTVRLVITVGILIAAVAAGCRKAAYFQRSIAFDQAETHRADGIQAYLSVRETSAGLQTSRGGGGGYGTVFAASRYIAVRHKLEIVEPGSALPKSLEVVVSFCGSIQCEVLSSNISGTAADANPSGSVSMRVAPQDLNKLLDFAAKQGKISQHSTETEDKTTAVVDVEAKLKNQTEFRDSLRKMLAKPSVSVADLLQIQEKLAEAQAELDSEATQRKVLANETEKVAVEIAFRSEFHSTRGAFASVGEALRDSGSVLADSLAALITAIAAIIPWLIVLVPGAWFLIKAFKKWRKNRTPAKASAAPSS